MKKIATLLCLSLTTISFAAFAAHKNSGYLALDAGIFNADFNNSYIDQTDSPPINFQQSVTQNGYTGGLALGYRRFVNKQYFVGAEISGNIDANSAVYTPGSSSASYLTDKTKINNHEDLVFVPGIKLTRTVSAYAKIGLSLASISDNLSSMLGQFNTTTLTNFNGNTSVFGLAAGLGISKSLCKHMALFTQADYHDYGNVNFQNFQNGSSSVNYSHSSHIYSYDVVVGAAYKFV